MISRIIGQQISHQVVLCKHDTAASGEPGATMLFEPGHDIRSNLYHREDIEEDAACGRIPEYIAIDKHIGEFLLIQIVCEGEDMLLWNLDQCCWDNNG